MHGQACMQDFGWGKSPIEFGRFHFPKFSVEQNMDRLKNVDLFTRALGGGGLLSVLRSPLRTGLRSAYKSHVDDDIYCVFKTVVTSCCVVSCMSPRTILIVHEAGPEY